MYSENSNEVKCPICGSHMISPIEKKKGFGVGKALFGAVLVGPVGLLAGAIGSQKTTLKCGCMKCGHVWTPGGIGNGLW